jgi:BRCA1/BRCA2-containing complex subunit 3
MYSEYQYCSSVQISIDAYSSCLNHALLTEAEEIMGILLGRCIPNNNNNNNNNIDYNNYEYKRDKDKENFNTNIIQIFSTICLSRKCKEKDRVEFDEIQIAKACEIADNISKKTKVDINVVGWYHSHPKITIPPSQVDLNTQFSQQYQGPFIGIIISCFNMDKNNLNQVN